MSSSAGARMISQQQTSKGGRLIIYIHYDKGGREIAGCGWSRSPRELLELKAHDDPINSGAAQIMTSCLCRQHSRALAHDQVSCLYSQYLGVGLKT